MLLEDLLPLVAEAFFNQVLIKQKLKKQKPCKYKASIVGVAGFEPATSSSQTRRDNRATLHPE